MKQILQNLKTGETSVEEIPCPKVKSKHLLVRTRFSLVSAGTERMLVDFGKSNLFEKVRSQPDKVKQVIDKIKTDGLVPTLNTVKNKLETPLPLGYCNVGIVDQLGDGVEHINVGDRVLSNGKHAEVVVVPKNLCARIPDNVDDESASFAVIGAIALQGIRLIKPTLGETIVVTGLGLIGLVAVQLLKANGCRVVGIDFDEEKLTLAQSFGAEIVNLKQGEDPVNVAEAYTDGRGVDAVLITASTQSNEPIHQAAAMCRKRGRIVLVGVVGMEMSRADFYEKELSFQVSCSYGPGRYDVSYEEQGNDYPLPYVRWTEQRNFEAILDLLSAGKLNFKPLVSHRYLIDDAAQAYEVISSSKPLGVLIQYPRSDDSNLLNRQRVISQAAGDKSKKASLGFIGAGNYAAAVLIPAFAKTKAQLIAVCSASGVSAVHVAKKFNISLASSDVESLLNDDQINTLICSTRHDSHAHWLIKALKAQKNIFVEKPLALTRAELNDIAHCLNDLNSNQILMVGFNRRYSPFIQTIKTLLKVKKDPLIVNITVNAGYIPADHWTQDSTIGGGRIIGEACHFIDLARFISNSSIVKTQAVAMDVVTKDSISINLGFANGSIANIQYLANGSKSFPKERVEIFCGGSILQLDNYKTLRGYKWPGFSKMKGRQDKGQEQCAATFIDAIETGDVSQLISVEELFEVATACFDVVDQVM